MHLTSVDPKLHPQIEKVVCGGGGGGQHVNDVRLRCMDVFTC